MSDYWEENGLVKPQSVIVCAACRVDGLIIAGARHWDSVMRAQAEALGLSRGDMARAEQGFINQFGEFFDRCEAFKIVKENGQPFNPERNGSTVKLFSEGLY